MKRFFVLCVVFALVSLGARAEGRMVITMEQVFNAMPLIFEGTVVKKTTVAAPIKEAYFTYEDKALEVDLSVEKAWKGNPPQSFTVYSWAEGSAPCTGVKLEEGKKYLMWADYDTSGKYVLFDFCRDFMPSDSISTPEVRAKIEQMFGK